MSRLWRTDPLQLIKEPMVLASRQLKPVYLAAKEQPPNFPANARTQIATVNPQIFPDNRMECPSASSAHICDIGTSIQQAKVRGQSRKCKILVTFRIWIESEPTKLTRGRKITVTISSSFSVSAIARPPSRGTIIPARNAPVNATASKKKKKKDLRMPKVHTKYCVNADNIGKEGGAKQNQNRNGHKEHSWSILDGACRASEPEQDPTDEE